MIYCKIKNTYFFWVFILLSCLISCKQRSNIPKLHKEFKIVQYLQHDKLSVTDSLGHIIISKPVNYLNLLQDKVVALVANQTSVVQQSDTGYIHLIDTLLSLKINIEKVFAPEHGFRGLADAGEYVKNEKDLKTGLTVVSLYGKNKKPTKDQLKGIDIIVFDIQDVGVRFYTYISTLHYVMEACAEMGISLIVIDRPNPNAHYIDGPVLEPAHKSFLGMHPVPLVYGMTIGEYAKMINGEKWLPNNLQCKLTVMKMKHYDHHTSYHLPFKPSPNLPNDKAINLYPSLGLFEGTSINAGRGTSMQFQIFGAPFLNKNKYDFSYTPLPNSGAKFPKQHHKLCYGLDLRSYPTLSEINLNWLIETFNNTPKGKILFQSTFTAHAGTQKLQRQIESGMTAGAIKKTWQKDLNVFKKIRQKYLIYK
jgi:uncharacterized protein YbbC (DUF1343 family)